MKVLSFLKAIVLLLGMLIIALGVFVFGIPWWGNPKLNRAFIGSFSFFARKLIGIELIKIDEHKIFSRRPAVLIGNHQSALDFALIGSLSPPYSVVVGKREILSIPILGWYFKAAGNLLIDRSDQKDSRQQLNRLGDILVRKNLTVSIFPEGTRNKQSNEQMLPFKKGAFHVALSKGLPIIPVVCTSLKGIAVWERFELAGGKVIVKVMDPVETQGLSSSDLNELMEGIRNKMQIELDDLNTMVQNETHA